MLKSENICLCRLCLGSIGWVPFRNNIVKYIMVVLLLCSQNKASLDFSSSNKTPLVSEITLNGQYATYENTTSYMLGSYGGIEDTESLEYTGMESIFNEMQVKYTKSLATNILSSSHRIIGGETNSIVSENPYGLTTIPEITSTRMQPNESRRNASTLPGNTVTDTQDENSTPDVSKTNYQPISNMGSTFQINNTVTTKSEQLHGVKDIATSSTVSVGSSYVRISSIGSLPDSSVKAQPSFLNNTGQPSYQRTSTIPGGQTLISRVAEATYTNSQSSTGNVVNFHNTRTTMDNLPQMSHKSPMSILQTLSTSLMSPLLIQPSSSALFDLKEFPLFSSSQTTLQPLPMHTVLQTSLLSLSYAPMRTQGTSKLQVTPVATLKSPQQTSQMLLRSSPPISFPSLRPDLSALQVPTSILSLMHIKYSSLSPTQTKAQTLYPKLLHSPQSINIQSHQSPPSFPTLQPFSLMYSSLETGPESSSILMHSQPLLSARPSQSMNHDSLQSFLSLLPSSLLYLPLEARTGSSSIPTHSKQSTLRQSLHSINIDSSPLLLSLPSSLLFYSSTETTYDSVSILTQSQQLLSPQSSHSIISDSSPTLPSLPLSSSFYSTSEIVFESSPIPTHSKQSSLPQSLHSIISDSSPTLPSLPLSSSFYSSPEKFFESSPIPIHSTQFMLHQSLHSINNDSSSTLSSLFPSSPSYSSPERIYDSVPFLTQSQHLSSSQQTFSAYSDSSPSMLSLLPSSSLFSPPVAKSEFFSILTHSQLLPSAQPSQSINHYSSPSFLSLQPSSLLYLSLEARPGSSSIPTHSTQSSLPQLLHSMRRDSLPSLPSLLPSSSSYSSPETTYDSVSILTQSQQLLSPQSSRSIISESSPTLPSLPLSSSFYSSSEAIFEFSLIPTSSKKSSLPQSSHSIISDSSSTLPSLPLSSSFYSSSETVFESSPIPTHSKQSSLLQSSNSIISDSLKTLPSLIPSSPFYSSPVTMYDSVSILSRSQQLLSPKSLYPISSASSLSMLLLLPSSSLDSSPVTKSESFSILTYSQPLLSAQPSQSINHNSLLSFSSLLSSSLFYLSLEARPGYSSISSHSQHLPSPQSSPSIISDYSPRLQSLPLSSSFYSSSETVFESSPIPNHSKQSSLPRSLHSINSGSSLLPSSSFYSSPETMYDSVSIPTQSQPLLSPQSSLSIISDYSLSLLSLPPSPSLYLSLEARPESSFIPTHSQSLSSAQSLHSILNDFSSTLTSLLPSPSLYSSPGKMPESSSAQTHSHQTSSSQSSYSIINGSSLLSLPPPSSVVSSSETMPESILTHSQQLALPQASYSIRHDSSLMLSILEPTSSFYSYPKPMSDFSSFLTQLPPLSSPLSSLSMNHNFLPSLLSLLPASSLFSSSEARSLSSSVLTHSHILPFPQSLHSKYRHTSPPLLSLEPSPSLYSDVETLLTSSSTKSHSQTWLPFQSTDSIHHDSLRSSVALSPSSYSSPETRAQLYSIPTHSKPLASSQSPQSIFHDSSLSLLSLLPSSSSYLSPETWTESSSIQPQSQSLPSPQSTHSIRHEPLLPSITLLPSTPLQLSLELRPSSSSRLAHSQPWLVTRSVVALNLDTSPSLIEFEPSMSLYSSLETWDVSSSMQPLDNLISSSSVMYDNSNLDIYSSISTYLKEMQESNQTVSESEQSLQTSIVFSNDSNDADTTMKISQPGVSLHGTLSTTVSKPDFTSKYTSVAVLRASAYSSELPEPNLTTDLYNDSEIKFSQSQTTKEKITSSRSMVASFSLISEDLPNKSSLLLESKRKELTLSSIVQETLFSIKDHSVFQLEPFSESDYPPISSTTSPTPLLSTLHLSVEEFNHSSILKNDVKESISNYQQESVNVTEIEHGSSSSILVWTTAPTTLLDKVPPLVILSQTTSSYPMYLTTNYLQSRTEAYIDVASMSVTALKTPGFHWSRALPVEEDKTSGSTMQNSDDMLTMATADGISFKFSSIAPITTSFTQNPYIWDTSNFQTPTILTPSIYKQSSTYIKPILFSLNASPVMTTIHTISLLTPSFHQPKTSVHPASQSFMQTEQDAQTSGNFLRPTTILPESMSPHVHVNKSPESESSVDVFRATNPSPKFPSTSLRATTSKSTDILTSDFNTLDLTRNLSTNSQSRTATIGVGFENFIASSLSTPNGNIRQSTNNTSSSVKTLFMTPQSQLSTLKSITSQRNEQHSATPYPFSRIEASNSNLSLNLVQHSSLVEAGITTSNIEKYSTTVTKIDSKYVSMLSKTAVSEAKPSPSIFDSSILEDTFLQRTSALSASALNPSIAFARSANSKTGTTFLMQTPDAVSVSGEMGKTNVIMTQSSLNTYRRSSALDPYSSVELHVINASQSLPKLMLSSSSNREPVVLDPSFLYTPRTSMTGESTSNAIQDARSSTIGLKATDGTTESHLGSPVAHTYFSLSTSEIKGSFSRVSPHNDKEYETSTISPDSKLSIKTIPKETETKGVTASPIQMEISHVSDSKSWATTMRSFASRAKESIEMKTQSYVETTLHLSVEGLSHSPSRRIYPTSSKEISTNEPGIKSYIIKTSSSLVSSASFEKEVTQNTKSRQVPEVNRSSSLSAANNESNITTIEASESGSAGIVNNFSNTRQTIILHTNNDHTMKPSPSSSISASPKTTANNTVPSDPTVLGKY